MMMTNSSLQAGRNRTTRHWWGTRTYTNRSRTTYWANRFGRRGAQLTLAGLLAGKFALPMTATVAGLSGAYFVVLAEAMHHRNNGHSRGIVVSMPWIPLGFSTARQ